ncbi:hypothetical protein IQ06DRAFT_307941 [Phaeosphaeriaceae sp. SRC1lsM3a]|nr:hypothetical protein IQ06DRAFT_307941 [Stagonospora sp. SRC1lsM3a]
MKLQKSGLLRFLSAAKRIFCRHRSEKLPAQGEAAAAGHPLADNCHYEATMAASNQSILTNSMSFESSIPQLHPRLRRMRSVRNFFRIFTTKHDSDEDCIDLIGNLLAEIEIFRRVDVMELCARLGRGWPAAETILKDKFAYLLAPDE